MCVSECLQIFPVFSLLSDWDFKQFKFLVSSSECNLNFRFIIIVSLFLSKCFFFREISLWASAVSSFVIFLSFICLCDEIVWDFVCLQSFVWLRFWTFQTSFFILIPMSKFSFQHHRFLVLVKVCFIIKKVSLWASAVRSFVKVFLFGVFCDVVWIVLYRKT